jgi:ribonuclease P protein component
MRLKKSRDFRRVQGRGRKIRQPNLMLLVLPGQGSRTRIGLTVSRRVGNAVVRNRVKRWLREGLRHQYPDVSGCWDVVVIAHPSAAEADQAEISRQLSVSLDMLERKDRGGSRGARR